MSTRGYPLYTFKMILLGESGSGKTCLYHRIIHNHYRDEGTYENKTFHTTPTGTGGLTNVHYENHTKEVELSGNIRVNVKLFDTGAGERANSMTQNYYKNAHIVCLVYAVDSDLSFNALGKWIGDARFYLDESQRQPKMVFAMVGVKSDIPQYEREVKPEDVRRAAHHYKIPLDCCFEVSNISGDGVIHMMKQLAQKVFDLHTKQSSQSSTELQSYSSEYSGSYDVNIEPMTFMEWLCCCCCKRPHQNDYQRLPN